MPAVIATADAASAAARSLRTHPFLPAAAPTATPVTGAASACVRTRRGLSAFY
ncbi:hypothetical protein ABIA72_003674 [Stenotrophomonas rhizophila]